MEDSLPLLLLFLPPPLPIPLPPSSSLIFLSFRLEGKKKKLSLFSMTTHLSSRKWQCPVFIIVKNKCSDSRRKTCIIQKQYVTEDHHTESYECNSVNEKLAIFPMQSLSFNRKFLLLFHHQIKILQNFF